MRRIVGAAVLLTLACASAPPRERQGGRWHRFEASDGSFRVDFPLGAPQVTRTTIGTGTRATPRTSYLSYGGDRTFGVAVFEHSRYRVQDAATLLEHYPNPRASGIDGSVVEEAPLKRGRYIGRAVRMEGTAQGRSLKVVTSEQAWITDGRMYVVSSSGSGVPLSPDTKQFLESFVLLK